MRSPPKLENGLRRRASYAAAAVTRDPVLRVLVVAAFLVAVWYVAGWASEAQRVSFFWAIQVGLDITFVVLCLRLVRLAPMRPVARQFWRWIAVAGIFFTLGDTSQTVIALTTPGVRSAGGGSTLPSLLVAAGVVCTVWAMLRTPIQARGRERLRWWLDAATIMTGAAAFTWYFMWARPNAVGITRITLVLVSSGLMLVCAFSLVKLLLGGNPPFSRTAGVAAGISAAGVAISTALGPAISAGSLPLDVAMALRLLPCFLLAATPRIQEIQIRADPEVLVRVSDRLYSPLPYLAVGATQALLVLVLIREGLGIRAWGALIAAIVDTSLVVLRQLVAFSDNARLLTSLDETMLTVRRQEERFRSLVQHASDLTLVTDPALVVSYATPATRRLLGAAPERVMSGSLRDLIHADDQSRLDRATAEAMSAPRVTVTTQVRARHTDGSWLWLEVACTNLVDDPSVSGIIWNVRDITEAHHFQERLRYEATHDALTQLANRSLFEERTRTDVATADRRAEDRVGILVIDLDDFKTVNDRFGHSIGDELLVAVARRLLSCVRPDDTVARLGGDEFAVLLPGASVEEAAAVASRILRALREPVHIRGHDVRSAASIGVTVGRYSDADALLRASDEAMYEAKRGGKSGMILGGEAQSRSRRQQTPDIGTAR